MRMCKFSTAMANISLGGRSGKQKRQRTPEGRMHDMMRLIKSAKDEIESSDFWRYTPCLESVILIESKAHLLIDEPPIYLC